MSERLFWRLHKFFLSLSSMSACDFVREIKMSIFNEIIGKVFNIKISNMFSF